MIYKALFQIIQEGDELSSVIQWSGAHPGNEIEALLRGFSSGLVSAEGIVDICYTLSDTFLFVHWTGEHGHFLLQSLDLIDFKEWVNDLWNLLQSTQCDYLSCRELIAQGSKIKLDLLQPVSFEKLTETFPLKEGELSSKYDDLQSFANLMFSISTVRPWLINFLESIKFNREEHRLKIKYQDQFLNTVDLEKLSELEKAIYEGKNDVAYLVSRASTSCFNYFYENRFHKFAVYVTALHELLKVSEKDSMSVVYTMGMHLTEFLEIDREFFIDKINHLLSMMSSSIHDVTPEMIQKIIDLSIKLYDNEILDLAKIAEGSAFELTLQLDDVATKFEFYNKFMESSIKWGTIHVIGLLNILNGVIGDSKEERRIYGQLLEPAIPLLYENENGKQALVEAFLKSNQIDKAVSTKFSLTDEIRDEEQMAREIFKSIRWMITQEKISQKVLRKILETYLPRALENAIPGEPLHKEIQYIYEDIEARSLDGLMVRITTVIIKNLNKVALIDRFDLLELIHSRLSEDTKFQDLTAAVKGKMFEVAIEEGMEERAEEIFQETLGLLNPESPNYFEHLLRFCKRVLITSAKFNTERYIDFVMDMFLSEINTPEKVNIYKRDIFDLISEAIKTSDGIPPLKDEHPGIRLYKHAYRLALHYESADLVEKLIEEAPTFSFTKQDYIAYSNFTVLQIRVQKSNKGNWLQTMMKAINSLVGVKEYEIAKNLISEILSDEHDPDILLSVYKKELDIAEKVDENFLSAEEIQRIRDHIISLSKSSDPTPEIILQYTNSINDLISMGKEMESMKKILEAIEYCITTGNSLSEFRSMLFAQLQQHSENLDNMELVKTVFYVVRKLVNLVDGAPLTVLPFIRLGTELLVNRRLYAETRIFLIEMISKVSESMSTLGMTDKREIESIIQIYERTLRTKKGNLNSSILNFKIRFELYSAVGNHRKLIELLDNVISKLKESSYKEKRIKGSFVTGIFIISQSFIIISESVDANIKRRFIHLVTDYLESMLPLTQLGSDLYTLLLELKSKLLENPEGTLYTIAFYIKPLQEIIDEN